MTDRKAVSAGFDSHVAQPWVGNARSQRGMWSATVVVGHPRCQDFAQVPLAQRNNPVQTLTPQSPDQSFAKRVRLRAAHRRGDNLKAEPGQRSVQFGGKDRVVVVDDETILVVEWDGISQLLQSPRGGGMGRRIEVNQSTRGMLHCHKYVEDSKGGGHYDAEVT